MLPVRIRDNRSYKYEKTEYRKRGLILQNNYSYDILQQLKTKIIHCLSDDVMQYIVLRVDIA